MPCLVLCFLARRKEVLVLYLAFISCLLVDMDHQKQNYLEKFILRSHVTIVFTVCSFLKHWPGQVSAVMERKELFELVLINSWRRCRRLLEQDRSVLVLGELRGPSADAHCRLSCTWCSRASIRSRFLIVHPPFSNFYFLSLSFFPSLACKRLVISVMWVMERG
jgi:hypothetical protein